MATKTPVSRSNLRHFLRYEATANSGFARKGGIYALDHDDGSESPRFRWISGTPHIGGHSCHYVNLANVVGLSEAAVPTPEGDPVTRGNLRSFPLFKVTKAARDGAYHVGGIYTLERDDGSLMPRFQYVSGPTRTDASSDNRVWINLTDLVGLTTSPTQEQNTMTTPTKIVNFTMHYRVSTGLISLIRCLRDATGAPLKEAKDLVEASRMTGGVRNVRLTERQFGRFLAEVLADNQVSLADVRITNVTVTDSVPQPIFDFTRSAA